MVLLSKFRADTAENGPVKVEKMQFSKNHFSPLSTNFSILSSFNARTRRDLAPGTENFPKIYSKMTNFFFPKMRKYPKKKKQFFVVIDACPDPLSDGGISGKAHTNYGGCYGAFYLRLFNVFPLKPFIRFASMSFSRNTPP